ncbi:MAG: hypothetical protein ACRDZV_07440 [Acidimicrobiia bacterium]
MARAIEDRNERRVVVEQRRDRLELAREAGFGAVSGVAVAAGVLTALGVCAIALGITAAVVNGVGIDTEALSDGDWRNLGVIAAGATVLVLLVAFAFGGYVAGRVARRMGAAHGALVCGFGIAALGVAGGIAHLQDVTVAARDHIERLGAPTAGAEWAGIGAVAGIAGIVAVIAGGLLGGVRGERWHQRLMDRALDPAVGPEADLVKRQRRLERAERRLASKREKAERRGVLVASRYNSGEIPVVRWDEAAAATTEPNPEPRESERESESVTL